MMLAVDIGNTTVVMGAFFGESDQPRWVRRMPTRHDFTPEQWLEGLRGLLEDDLDTPVEGSVLSSVVPPATATLLPALEELCGKAPLVLGPDTAHGIDIPYYDKKKLGNDRVADAIAVKALFPLPAAIFDMGTATTLSVLDEDGRFIGGMILPGIRLMLESLSAQAFQLPEITIAQPTSVLANDTVTGMQNGIVYGAASMIDGLAMRVEERIGRPVNTIVTGGLCRFIVPYCRRDVKFEQHLLLRGLRQLWLRYREKGLV